MTIAIGVLCSDGIVLAADSKESGYQTKVYRPKIFELDVLDDNIKVVLAGSGDPDFLDALKEKIEEAIDRASPTLASVQSKTEVAIQSYCRKIWPLYDPKDRPQAEMLIGVRTPDGQCLLRTNGPIVRVAHHPYESIGFGADFSAYQMGRLFMPGLTLATAYPVTVYVLTLVKENVEYCGGPSHVCTISADGVQRKTTDEINTLTDSFKGFAALTDKLLARTTSLRFMETVILSDLVEFYEEHLPRLYSEKEKLKALHDALIEFKDTAFTELEGEVKQLLDAEQHAELRAAIATFGKYLDILGEKVNAQKAESEKPDSQESESDSSITQP